jgi:hypothetical protein
MIQVTGCRLPEGRVSHACRRHDSQGYKFKETINSIKNAEIKKNEVQLMTDFYFSKNK